MPGRIAIVGILVLVALAWMLADASDRPTLPMPPKAETLQPPMPPAIPMETVDLPPPPAPAAAMASADPAPKARAVTPLQASAPPAEKPLTVTPIRAAAPAPQPVPTRAVEPLKPSDEIEKAEDTADELTPLKAEPKPTAKPEPKAEPAPRPERSVAEAKPEPQPVPQPDLKKAADEGRPLLRLLEIGEGPSVEIAWPASAAERRHLYRVFRQCYGMEIAVMDTGGRLYGEAGPAGTAWDINMDRYSGFVRQSSGGAALEEHETARQIRLRHGIGGEATVRLFPRAADAILLGGLKQLIGSGYAGNVRIRARYEVSGWHVGVSGLSVDARPVAGRVDLSAAARRNCSI
jgi:hypothetical protein